MTVIRRLAAILAADVVGFSRLMEADEAGTLAALKARRKDVLEPLVAKHQGRVFKVTGDGVLIEFASAVNAVQCAVDLQQGMAAANEGQPEDRHIVLRIGVNLGDVMVEGGDLYGDGINIAARLESIAEPGGILVSGTAYDYVRNKVKVGFDDLGTQTLKNIAEAVRTYRVTGTPAVTAAPKAATDKPSIAVLPFANMSGDPEQEYFSDGITEDIITALSRFRNLFVIARNSSFQYRGKNVDVRRVARDLGVQYVIEGSVRKSGDRLRVTAQLIEAASGNHVWSERFDRGLDDVFAIQDEVARSVVARLEGQLAASGADLARRKPVAHLTAYDYVLQARRHNNTMDVDRSIPLLQRAVQIDPDYAQAYIYLSLGSQVKYFFDGQAEHLDDALQFARKAIALDPNDAVAFAALGYVQTLRVRFESHDARARRRTSSMTEAA